MNMEEEKKNTIGTDHMRPHPEREISGKSEKGKVDKNVRKYQMVLTFCLVGLYISMGLYDGIFRTTLPDLRDRLGTSTDQMTFARSFKEIGRLVGGILGGIFSDRFQAHSRLFLSISLVSVGSSVFAVPWSHYLPVAGCLYFVEGTAQGSIDSIANALLANLWGEKADPALHSIHFGYMVGSTLAPVLTAPYLSPDDDHNCTAVNSTVTSCEDIFSTSTPEGYFDEGSRIEIPYGIAGSITFFVGIVFMVLHCIKEPSALVWHSPEKKSLKEVFSPGSCAGGRSGLGAVLVTLLVFYYVLLSAQGMGIWTLNFTYATESKLDFDKSDASLMEFTGSMVGLVARAIMILASRFLSPTILLFFTVFSSTIVVGLLGFVGTRSQTLFWVFGNLNGFVNAPAWGSAYAFIDKYIILYAFVVALTSLGAGLAGFAFQSLHGYLYENALEESFLYLSFAMAVLWSINTIVMYIVARKLGYRHTSEEEDVQDDKAATIKIEWHALDAKAYINEGMQIEQSDNIITSSTFEADLVTRM